MANDGTERSTWSRPGFIAAATVVALILVAAIVLGINALNRDDDAVATPTATASSTPSSTPTPSSDALVPGQAESDSVCGLDDVEKTGTLTMPPEVEWTFLDTAAVPGSADAGPGVVSDSGMRSCFARTPEGAVVMAANAAVQGSVPGVASEWMEYVVASGPGREIALSDPSSSVGSSDTRLAIQGFRLLNYDGDTALVDVAIRATTADGRTVLGSWITPLRWEDGDWRLVVTDDGQLEYELTVLPDTAGYVSWAA